MRKQWMKALTLTCIAAITMFFGKVPARAQSMPDISAAAFGEVYNYDDLNLDPSSPNSYSYAYNNDRGSQGDTWYGAWTTDGFLYFSHDDGCGFQPYSSCVGPGVQYANTGLTRVDGNPDSSTVEVQGTNITPSISDTTNPLTPPSCLYDNAVFPVSYDYYSDGLFAAGHDTENNILYLNRRYSAQNQIDADGNLTSPAMTAFIDCNNLYPDRYPTSGIDFPLKYANYGNLTKSAYDAVTNPNYRVWTDKDGHDNTQRDPLESTYALSRRDTQDYMFNNSSWLTPIFVNYGQGGAPPSPPNPVNDGSSTYDYVTSVGDADVGAPFSVYLARIARANLDNPSRPVTRSDIEWYAGNGNWSSNISDEASVLTTDWASAPQVTYDNALQRYVLTLVDFFYRNYSPESTNTYTPDRYVVYTSQTPWGPWRGPIMDHALPVEFLGGVIPNKWTSPDGKKMWMVSTGQNDYYPYGFNFHPLYLSTGTVETHAVSDQNYQDYIALSDGVSRPTNYPSSCSPNCPPYAEFGQNPTNGESVTLKIHTVNGTGNGTGSWHIISFRYASPHPSSQNACETDASCFGSKVTLSTSTNGTIFNKVKDVTLSFNDDSFSPSHDWVEYSGIFYLQNGTDTNWFRIEFDTSEGDDARDLKILQLKASEDTTYDEGTNLALAPNATASSPTMTNVTAVNDGCATCRGGRSSDTMTNGGCVRLTWSGSDSGCGIVSVSGSPVTIGKIKLYDSPDATNQIIRGHLVFDDHEQMPVSYLQNDGQTGTVITFSPKPVSWVEFHIDQSTSNSPGVSQFEAYQLSGTPSPSRTKVDDGGTGVSYGGSGWTTPSCTSCYNGTEHFDSTTGDYVTLTFTGTSVDVGAKMTSASGYMDVSIDGGPSTKVDLYSASTSYKWIRFSRTHLANTAHTLKVKVNGTHNPSSSGNQIDVDFFDYD